MARPQGHQVTGMQRPGCAPAARAGRNRGSGFSPQLCLDNHAALQTTTSGEARIAAWLDGCVVGWEILAVGLGWCHLVARYNPSSMDPRASPSLPETAMLVPNG